MTNTTVSLTDAKNMGKEAEWLQSPPTTCISESLSYLVTLVAWDFIPHVIRENKIFP